MIPHRRRQPGSGGRRPGETASSAHPSDDLSRRLLVPCAGAESAAGPLLPVEPSRRGRYVPAVLDAIIPGVGPPGRRPPPARAAVPDARSSSPSRPSCHRPDDLAPRASSRASSTSDVIWGLLAFQGFLLVWRLLAVGSSLTAPGLPRLRRRRRDPGRAPAPGRHRPAGLRRLRRPRSRARPPTRSSSKPPPVAAVPVGRA